MAGFERGVRPIGTLIDVDDLVDVLDALDPVVGAGHHAGPIELPGERGVEQVGDERRFSRSGDAGHRHEQPERDFDGEIPQVVAAGADQPEAPLGIAGAPQPGAPESGAPRGGTAR